MATVTVTASKLIRTNEASTAVTPTAFASTNTIKVPFTSKNMVIAITPSSGAGGNITVSKGDGIAGINDLVVAVTAEKTSYIQLDSSSYEQISGENKGYAILTAASGVAGTITVVNAL